MRAPSERSTSSCITTTFSGHAVSVWVQQMSVRRNLEEPLLQLAMTMDPQRQQVPSTTCSFASTVWQLDTS